MTFSIFTWPLKYLNFPYVAACPAWIGQKRKLFALVAVAAASVSGRVFICLLWCHYRPLAPTFANFRPPKTSGVKIKPPTPKTVQNTRNVHFESSIHFRRPLFPHLLSELQLSRLQFSLSVVFKYVPGRSASFAAILQSREKNAINSRAREGERVRERPLACTFARRGPRWFESRTRKCFSFRNTRHEGTGNMFTPWRGGGEILWQRLLDEKIGRGSPGTDREISRRLYVIRFRWNPPVIAHANLFAKNEPLSPSRRWCRYQCGRFECFE